MQLLISEIFDLVEKAKTKAERKEILLKNNSPRFGEFVGYIFGDNEFFIKNESDIPEWYPSKEEKGYTPSNILHELRRFYVLLDETDNITNKRKGEILAQMLESIHPEESMILISLLLGTLKIKGFSRKLASEIWPDNVSVQQSKK